MMRKGAFPLLTIARLGCSLGNDGLKSIHLPSAASQSATPLYELDAYSSLVYTIYFEF